MEIESTNKQNINGETTYRQEIDLIIQHLQEFKTHSQGKIKEIIPADHSSSNNERKENSKKIVDRVNSEDTIQSAREEHIEELNNLIRLREREVKLRYLKIKNETEEKRNHAKQYKEEIKFLLKIFENGTPLYQDLIASLNYLNSMFPDL